MIKTLSEVVKKGKGFAVALAAMGMFPIWSIAQTTTELETGPYPTPHIVTRGNVTIRSSGLKTQYYVTKPDQSGGGASGGEQYVFYEPPIFLKTVASSKKDQDQLDAVISDDGVLALRFVWDTDVEATEAAIRDEISDKSFKDATISPFFAEKSWFESSHNPNNRSNTLPRQSFMQRGEMVAYFDFENRGDAEKFLRRLNGEPNVLPVSLNFRYSFSGVSVERCTARVTGQRMRNVVESLDLEGEGSAHYVNLEEKGTNHYVGRDQLSEYVYNIFGDIAIETSCRDDSDAVEKLAQSALDKLGDPNDIMKEVWTNFNTETGLNPNDFAADLINSLNKFDAEVTRDQTDNTTRLLKELEAAAKGAGVGGWGAFALSGSFANASDDTKVKFKDALRKYTDDIQFTGTTYVPKDVEKRINDVLKARWSSGVSVSYNKLIDEIGDEYTITLSKLNWANLDRFQDEKIVFQINENLDDLQMQLDDLQMQLADLQMQLDGRFEITNNDIFLSTADLESRMIINMMELESGMIERVNRFESRMATMINSHTYSLSLHKPDMSDRWAYARHNTLISRNLYPAAWISHWKIRCDGRFRTGPHSANFIRTLQFRPELIVVKDIWHIIFPKIHPDACDEIRLVVTYVHHSLVGDGWQFKENNIPLLGAYKLNYVSKNSCIDKHATIKGLTGRPWQKYVGCMQSCDELLGFPYCNKSCNGPTKTLPSCENVFKQ